jgi:4-amino-4-deoxy-L-arabinose transferase-like glycosyltransferase
MEARKLPRLYLLALCLAYVLPGLIGRDPWSGEDAVGYGIVSNMLAGQTLLDWLLPSISGLPMVAKGPLTYWLGSAVSGLLPHWALSLGLRITAGLWTAAMMLALWYAAYSLARRPEVQPNDPLNAAATRIDFARAIADSCLLILMACLGLIARIHEFTAESLQVALIALFLFGCAQGLRLPRRAGLAVGAVIGASLVTRGLPLALALFASVCLLPVFIRQYRLVSRSFLPMAALATLAVGAAWPLTLFWLSLQGFPSADSHLQAWWQATTGSLGLELVDTGSWLGRNALWYTWPAWPIAVWALIRWRGKRLEPAIALPLITSTMLLLALLFSKRIGEAHMLPLLPALALLAAFGLPALSRSLVSLMDWFALIVFSLFGIAAWAYWIAFVTGTPEKMARGVERFAAGYKTQDISVALVFGVCASVAWIVLIWWRTSRHTRTLWRPVALSSAGMVLAWFLLMTLWLPIFNYKKTYTDLAHTLAAQVDPRHQCISTVGVSASQRALFMQGGPLKFEAVSYAQIRIRRGAQITNEAGFNPKTLPSTCDYLLIEDRSDRPRAGPDASWSKVWEGRRPSDRRERFRLFRVR